MAVNKQLAICLSVVGMILFISLLSASFASVDFGHVGLKYYGISQEIDPKTPFSAGRYTFGPGFYFHEFPTTVQTVIFNGTGLRKPIGFKDSIGGSFTVEISLAYQLLPDSVYEIYKTYRFNWEDSYLSNIRSILRQRAQRYSMLQFVQNSQRTTIESDFTAAVASVLKPQYSTSGTVDTANATSGWQDSCPAGQTCQFRGGAKVNFVKIGLVALDSTKEQIILQTQYNQINPQITAESEKVGQINKNTTNILTRMTQAISTLTAEKNQEIANARTSIQQSEQRIVSETDKVTRDITVQSQANITLYKTETENTRAVQQLQVETTRANTEQEVRRIRENMDRETVANDYQIRMIQANRDAAKAQISSAAEADAIRIIANATQTVLKNLTNSIGFSAEELNVLSWTDMVAAYRKVHLDLQRPSVMLLPGQQELFYESLSNSNS